MRVANSGRPAEAVLAFPADHRSHPSAEIEWWYQFAFLNDDYTLMACLWRYRASEGRDGWMGTYAITQNRAAADTTHAHYTGACIDPAILRISRGILSKMARPDGFTRGVLEITKSGESFAPYRLVSEAKSASTRALPIEVSLGPMSLNHVAEEHRMELRIDDDRAAATVSFDLECVSFPMNGSGSLEVSGKTMYGYTFPQSPVTGEFRISGETHEARGKAWLDHQWGEWTFEAQNGEIRHPEWHYFAIPFPQGSSLVLCLNRDRSQELVCGSLCHADGRVDPIAGASVRRRDEIESLRTRNVYDYGWSLSIPELDAELTLTPFHPDHEVFTFTRERGVLELGVEVTGTIMGAACHTRGFVETFGRTADIQHVFWEGDSINTRRQIQKFLPPRCTQEWLSQLTGLQAPREIETGLVDYALLDPIRSMIDRGGKAWRSNWFALCCHALEFSGTDEQIRELLPIIELVHTGSLIIDDIEDASPFRRGLPSLHCQIGTDLAINAGNFLYFLPLLLIQQIPWLTAKQRLKAYERIVIGQRQGHLGQALDLMWSKGRCDIENKVAKFAETKGQLLEQYRLKSGCQLEAAARIAGSLADAPDRLIDPLSEYSQTFGVAFQIVDDVDDASTRGDEMPGGKRTGEDLRNGRLNIVLLHALAGSPAARRDCVLKALTDPAHTGCQTLVAELIQETEALNQCLDLADELITKSSQNLAALVPSDARIALWSLPKLLVESRRHRARSDKNS